MTAYSPLANLNPAYEGRATSRAEGTGAAVGKGEKEKVQPPSLLHNEVIGGIAKERGCTNAQVALAWGMGRHTSVIPKSSHDERILENYESLNCGLYGEDFEAIEEIGEKHTYRFNKQGAEWGVKLFEGLEDPDD